MITYAASAPKIHGFSVSIDDRNDDCSLLTNLTVPLAFWEASSCGMPSETFAQ